MKEQTNTKTKTDSEYNKDINKRTDTFTHNTPQHLNIRNRFCYISRHTTTTKGTASNRTGEQAGSLQLRKVRK